MLLQAYSCANIKHTNVHQFFNYPDAYLSKSTNLRVTHTVRALHDNTDTHIYISVAQSTIYIYVTHTHTHTYTHTYATVDYIVFMCARRQRAVSCIRTTIQTHTFIYQTKRTHARTRTSAHTYIHMHIHSGLHCLEVRKRQRAPEQPP